MSPATAAPRWVVPLGAAAAALVAGPAVAVCGEGLPAGARLQAEATGPQPAADPGWQLAFAPRPAPAPVGRHFALDIVVCAPAGRALPATLAVDADMPAHRHGMNYRATVRAQGEGRSGEARYAADGLMFHMPGRWRVVFELPALAGQPPLRLAREFEVR